MTSTKAQQPTEDLTTKSLEELMKIEVASVYSASKYLQKVTEAPSSVSIVTAEQIQKYGYRTLAELLRNVRGFYGTYDRNYSYLGVRGFARPGDYNTRILLLVDGHRMNDNVYDQALLGTEFPIDIDLIERVEIIRGPSSSLYGTSAFFAVVNVITKRGRDLKGLEASGEVASFGTYKGRFSYGNKFHNGFELLLSGSYYDSRGPQRLFYPEYANPANNNGIAEQVDDDQSKSLFGQVSFRQFNLRGVYGSREKGIPTGAYDTLFNDPRTRTIDQRGYLEFQYERTFSNQLGLLVRAHYDQYNYDGAYVYEPTEGSTQSISMDVDQGRGEWWGGEIQLSKVLLRKHKFTGGTEYRDNLRQDQSNYEVFSRVQSIDDRRKSKNIAVYLQDEFTLLENLKLSAGVRHDQHVLFGGATKPRLGLIYQPATQTSLKFLYGEAFRAPNNYELFYYGSGNETSPSLRPEQIRASEVVMEQYLGGRVRLSASGYRYHIKGLISQWTNPLDDSILFRNTERVESRGLEFELDTKLARGLEARAAYTLQKTFDQQTQQILTNSPRHLGQFNLLAPLFQQKAYASLDLQYLSPRKTLNGTESEAVWLSNFTLFSQKIVRGLDLSFSIYNLFNQRYGDPGGEEHRQNTIAQNGRHFRLKLTHRF